MLPVAKLTERHPWLALCAEAADAEGFFHWELTFGPVFAEGGFDLQLGNPPWVRPVRGMTRSFWPRTTLGSALRTNPRWR